MRRAVAARPGRGMRKTGDRRPAGYHAGTRAEQQASADAGALPADARVAAARTRSSGAKGPRRRAEARRPPIRRILPGDDVDAHTQDQRRRQRHAAHPRTMRRRLLQRMGGSGAAGAGLGGTGSRPRDLLLHLARRLVAVVGLPLQRLAAPPRRAGGRRPPSPTAARTGPAAARRSASRRRPRPASRCRRGGRPCPARSICSGAM